MGRDIELTATTASTTTPPSAGFFIKESPVDRMQVYLGQVPLETDLLQTNKFAMIGLAKLASAILGSGPVLHSLPCTPGTGLTVSVGAGQIYQLANIDTTAYSSLAADTTHQILKQGILLDPVALSCPAPATAGQSINYMVQIGFQENDTGPTVLQYYNASNPSVPFVGPAGAGSSNATVRSGQCVVQVKAGAAAATGSQTTPSPDSGFIAAYVVTVAQGASSITSGNIAVASGAPFLAGLLNSHHSGGAGQAPKINLATEVQGTLPVANLPSGLTVWCGTSTGSGNAQSLTLANAVTAMPAGMALAWLAGFTNTGAATVTVAGGFGPYPIVKDGPAGPIALTGSEIVAGEVISGRFDGTSFHLEDTALGTAAMANASSNTGKVAAVTGAAVVGHLAVFSDTAGTVQDGGAPGVSTPSTYANASTTIGPGSYLVDTSAGPLTLTLLASPATGAVIEFIDGPGTWSASALTVNGNGKTIFGSTDPLVCDVSGEVFKIWFNGSDWRLF